MKKLISSLLILTIIFTSTVSFAFSDVSSSHWATEYIASLADKGIINGYEDGSFRPEGLVTKAELAKLVCEAFAPQDKEGNFSDITSHWAYTYITKSAKLFYAPSSDFLPDTPATRAEVAYVLANVLSLKGEKVLSFPDSDTVADAMKEKVAASVKAGLIEGYEDGTIRGDGSVTRAESAALIVRAMNYKAPEAETPEEKPEEKPETPSEKDHIYTLYPLRDLLLIRSVGTSVNEKGEEVRKITYSIAGEEEKVYTSAIPFDSEISVVGTRSSLNELAPGDVFMVDMAFLGYISTIAVVATFDASTPLISVPSALTYGSGHKYQFWAGTVTSYESKTNTVIFDADDGMAALRIIARKNTPVSVSHKKGTNHLWESDSVSAIDEGSFVFVRYTEDVVTEIIVK